MKTSLASRRSVLAAVLVIGVAAVSAGCASAGSSSTGSSSTGTPAAPATAAPSRIPLATTQPGGGGQPSLPPSIIACLRAQGVPAASTSTDKQVRQAFVALPVTSQERAFTACEHLFPASVRETIAKDIAKEKGMAT
jgi:hypothetical protein